MKSLGVEWGRQGIRMNCIAPGPIETEVNSQQTLVLLLLALALILLFLL